MNKIFLNLSGKLTVIILASGIIILYKELKW